MITKNRDGQSENPSPKKLECSKCGSFGEFSASKTDRFCSKCGNPFFTPISEIDTNTHWSDIYNSYYNLETLVPENTQYSVNRLCNWRYGVTLSGKMLRFGISSDNENLKKLDRSIVLHRSFFRGGYALGIVEEKLFSTGEVKTQNVDELISEGRKLFSDTNLFDSVWDVGTTNKDKKYKDYAQKIIFIAAAISNNVDDFFSAKETEHYIISIISDFMEWAKKEGFVGESENEESIQFDVVFGYSVRLAEKLVSKN